MNVDPFPIPLVALAVLLAAPSAAASDCLPDAGYVPHREPIERLSPTLLVGWTFDRSPAGYIGFEVSYSYQYRGTFGGYAHALLLSDPDAATRKAQLGIGGLAGPWSSPTLGACSEAPFVDPRPLARFGYAWRAANMEADATSFAQLGVSASAILGVIASFALPLQGGRSHGMQPGVAISLSLPIAVGRGY